MPEKIQTRVSAVFPGGLNVTETQDVEIEAYGKESNIPQKLFDILKRQRQELETLKNKYGSIVTPNQLMEDTA